MTRLQVSLVITAIEVVTIAVALAVWNATHNIVVTLAVAFVGLEVEHYVSLGPIKQ